MTNNNHPIAPPLVLVREWINKHYGGKVHREIGGVERAIATQSARWGADMELDACCEWLDQNTGRWDLLSELRAARRPNLTSLKKQALAELELLKGDAYSHGLGFDAPAIRRALDALPD